MCNDKVATTNMDIMHNAIINNFWTWKHGHIVTEVLFSAWPALLINNEENNFWEKFFLRSLIVYLNFFSEKCDHSLEYLKITFTLVRLVFSIHVIKDVVFHMLKFKGRNGATSAWTSSSAGWQGGTTVHMAPGHTSVI